jgi:hypothetical protein
MVNYADEMGQKSVMQKIFAILTEFLVNSSATREHVLSVWTLSHCLSFEILQFVQNSQPYEETLVSDCTKYDQYAHESYRHNDTRTILILQKAADFRKGLVEVRVWCMRKILDLINPVLRYVFFEQYPKQMVQYARHLSYIRFVALISVVGWIMGLGDGHLSDIWSIRILLKLLILTLKSLITRPALPDSIRHAMSTEEGNCGRNKCQWSGWCTSIVHRGDIGGSECAQGSKIMVIEFFLYNHLV